MGRANTNILRKQNKIKYLYIHNIASQISHGSKVGTFKWIIVNLEHLIPISNSGTCSTRWRSLLYPDIQFGHLLHKMEVTALSQDETQNTNFTFVGAGRCLAPMVSEAFLSNPF